MEQLLANTEVVIAIGIAIAALITAVAGTLRANDTIRKDRAKTNDKIRLMEVERVDKDKDHTQALELMEAQIRAERETQIRQSEQDIENRLRALMEQQIGDLNSRLEVVKTERNELRREVDALRLDFSRLQSQHQSEQKLREQLEGDHAKLRSDFDQSERQKRAVEQERDRLSRENRELKAEVGKLRTELADTRDTLANLERKFQVMEERDNGNGQGHNQAVDEFEEKHDEHVSSTDNVVSGDPAAGAAGGGADD